LRWWMEVPSVIVLITLADKFKRMVSR
jgi:hypothetical protein